MVDTYDVIVLGAGLAGSAVSLITRRSGASVLIVEANGFGGTCPLRGCIPKKVLAVAAETMECIKKAPEYGISVEGANLDWNRLFVIKSSVIGGIPHEREEKLKSLGITTLHGYASFTGPDSIAVDGKEYRGKKIVIATGAKPKNLPIPGIEHALTSDDILELDTLPSSIVFIGGGYIGVEFSHVFVRAGCRVTILEAGPRILAAMDEDLVERLSQYSQDLGIDIHTDARVESIEKTPQGAAITFTKNNRSQTIQSDVIANVTGRIANIDGLELDKAGIATDRKGIILDEYLRSVSNPHIFVAGDMVGFAPQLSPVATYDGRIVAHNILSSDLISPDYSSVPYAVFTVPSLCGVGLTEPEARAKGLSFISAYENLTRTEVGIVHADHVALSKVLIDSRSNRILGAHVLGHGAPELINIFALAMQHRITSRDLHDFFFTFPTFSSDIPAMVRIKRGER